MLQNFNYISNDASGITHHKKLRKERKMEEDGGAAQQQTREVAEEQARHAAQTGDEYSKLVADGMRYAAKDDYRNAGKAYREAIALRPDKPTAYYNLGAVLAVQGAVQALCVGRRRG